MGSASFAKVFRMLDRNHGMATKRPQRTAGLDRLRSSQKLSAFSTSTSGLLRIAFSKRSKATFSEATAAVSVMSMPSGGIAVQLSDGRSAKRGAWRASKSPWWETLETWRASKEKLGAISTSTSGLLRVAFNRRSKATFREATATASVPSVPSGGIAVQLSDGSSVRRGAWRASKSPRWETLKTWPRTKTSTT